MTSVPEIMEVTPHKTLSTKNVRFNSNCRRLSNETVHPLNTPTPIRRLSVASVVSSIQSDYIHPPNILTPLRRLNSHEITIGSPHHHIDIEQNRRYSSNFYKNTNYQNFLRQQTVQHDLRGNHNDVIIKIFGCAPIHILLTRLRMFLMLTNLIVLGATYLSFRAWIHVASLQRDYDDHFHINDWLKYPIGIVVQTSIARIDLFFIMSSCSLSIYYIVFGAFVSYNYGSGETDQLCTVLACPIIIILCSLQILMAWISFRMTEALNELDCSALQYRLSYNLLATLMDLKNFMRDHGPWLSGFYIASTIVQQITAMLPWCLHGLPYQRIMNCEEAATRNANMVVSDGDTEPPLYIGPSSAALVMVSLCKTELKEYHLR